MALNKVPKSDKTPFAGAKAAPASLFALATTLGKLLITE